MRPYYIFFSVCCRWTLEVQIFSWLLESPVKISRHELFTVFNHADFRKIDFLTIFSKLLLKYFWDCKQRQCLPNLQNAKTVLKSELNIIIHCNIKIRMIYENSGINFNKEWIWIFLLSTSSYVGHRCCHTVHKFTHYGQFVYILPVQDSIAVSEPGRGRSLRHGLIPRARVSFETSFDRNNPNWNWNN